MKANIYIDGVEYHKLTEFRIWLGTAPAPLPLQEQLLCGDVYIPGPTGSGKIIRAVMLRIAQLIREAKTLSGEISAHAPIVIIDLKGDSLLFHSARSEALQRGPTFRHFTVTSDSPTYCIDPFQGVDWKFWRVAQLCQLVLDALSLNHGEGYGRSYYAERSRRLKFPEIRIRVYAALSPTNLRRFMNWRRRKSNR